MYWFYVDQKAKRPTSESTWEDEVGLNFSEEDWQFAYMLSYGLTRNTRIQQLHYKITLGILACKEKLCTWKITDDKICDRCKADVDCIEHHLVACPNILQFWDSFFNWWRSTFQMSFPVDT